MPYYVKVIAPDIFGFDAAWIEECRGRGWDRQRTRYTVVGRYDASEVVPPYWWLVKVMRPRLVNNA